MKKFFKNNLKTILAVGATAVICISGTAFAALQYQADSVSYTTAKNSNIKNVEEALNDLYNKNNNANIEYIWAECNQNINYTYTVENSGTYIVGILNCNNDSVKGTIHTNAQTVLEKSFELGSSYTRTASVKLITAKSGEKIEIKGYNGQQVANAFVYKLNNINITSLVSADAKIDDTATLSYTANQDNEKILVLGISCGKTRTGNISYDGTYLSQDKNNNDVYIGYSILNKNAKVTISNYGYDWGAGAVFIFK